MGYTVAPLERLVEQLETLPGIGHKSAGRLAFFLLRQPEDKAAAFVSAIREARESIHECSVCCNLTDKELCPVCAAADRDRSVICVVEDPRDVAALERTREYHGLKPFPIKGTRLAYGIPVGGDLEYADEGTLRRSLEGRSEL